MNRSEAPVPGEPPGPEEGGDPPPLMPWTLVLGELDDGGWSADLEHGAPLPRIGERIVYIAEDGTRRHFRVSDITHTVQASASERPPVRESSGSPNATVSGPHQPHPPSALRAGLPRVSVTPED